MKVLLERRSLGSVLSNENFTVDELVRCCLVYDTALHYAFREKQVATANWLIMNGININITNNGTNTPLMFATATGLSDVMKTILKINAILNFFDSNGYTAIDHALYFKKGTDVIKVFFDQDEFDMSTIDLNGNSYLSKATSKVCQVYYLHR